MRKKKALEKKSLWLGSAFILIAGILIGFFIQSLMVPAKDAATAETKEQAEKTFAEKNIDDMNEKRLEFIEKKNAVINEMKQRGQYSCCLEKPCMYCIEKSPGHGEGAACRCAQDVLGGKHPCGECIGEILEGHGDKNLAKYFARSIAEEVGEEYTDTLKQIITEKYGIPVEEQI